jgi:hypothetical protein
LEILRARAAHRRSAARLLRRAWTTLLHWRAALNRLAAGLHGRARSAGTALLNRALSR